MTGIVIVIMTQNKLENLSSPTDMHTHTGSAFDNCLILTSGLVHAEWLQRTSSTYKMDTQTHTHRHTTYPWPHYHQHG